MPAEPAFVHLHVHSSYSLLEGALTIARMAELAKKDRQPALALTDTDNMFGALEFSEKLASAGIQPIVGCAMAVDFGDIENRGVEHDWPHINISWLDEATDGLIALSGGPGGPLDGAIVAGQRPVALSRCRTLQH